jgi:hypothetical protein
MRAGPAAGAAAWLVAGLAACLVAGVAAGCRGGSTRAKRQGSAAPVEVISQPQLPDGGVGPAASVDEVEPNDGGEVATPLPFGGTARGRIEPESDVDAYRLEVTAPGALQLALSGVDGQDLVLELADAAGSVLARSDRPGARVREGIPNFGVTPGRYTAYVRLAPKPKKPVRAKRGKKPPPEPEPAPAPVYELTAQLVAPAPSAEREPNDDRGQANELIVGEHVTGFVGWHGDADVWKLSVETLTEKNALAIEVSAVEGSALELEVADGLGRPLLVRKAPRGAALVVRGLVPQVAPGAPPFHYLTVRGDRSNPETAYQLAVRADLLAVDAEVEPNDTLERPHQLPADRTVVHATWTSGDVDHFALAISDAPRLVEITVDTPGDLDLALELFVDGKLVASANKGKKGAAERVSGEVPAVAQAVVRVKHASATATGDAPYDVTVHETLVHGDDAP